MGQIFLFLNFPPPVFLFFSENKLIIFSRKLTLITILDETACGRLLSCLPFATISNRNHCHPFHHAHENFYHPFSTTRLLVARQPFPPSREGINCPVLASPQYQRRENLNMTGSSQRNMAGALAWAIAKRYPLNRRQQRGPKASAGRI